MNSFIPGKCFVISNEGKDLVESTSRSGIHLRAKLANGSAPRINAAILYLIYKNSGLPLFQSEAILNLVAQLVPLSDDEFQILVDCAIATRRN